MSNSRLAVLPSSLILFSNRDQSGNIDLWVSNGTTAGTSELSVAGAYSEGLLYYQSPDFTVLGSEALFWGQSTTGADIWETDGTSAGTSEIAPAIGVFTALNSEVLFEGYDKNLWVTNGTSAGTSELSVAGAASGGLAPWDFTVLGSEALFLGYSANGYDVWVTDGTSAGTSQLIVPGLNSFQDIAVLGNKALLAWGDTLWVTDGTSAGTSGFVVPTLNSVEFPNSPASFVTFGSEVLFAGQDTNGFDNLWVTNGTAGGTSELTVPGTYSLSAHAGGLFYAQAPDFTLLGSEMMFAGDDAGGHVGLWETDGTAAGTSEIVGGAGYSSPSYGLNPNNMVVVGSKMFFVGTDTSSQTGLWETNGTASGTSELSILPSGLAIYTEYGAGLAAYGSELLFEVAPLGSAAPDLWITDGTAAGTSELVQLPLTTVTSVVASPSSGVEGDGATVTITVTMSTEVFVSGTPTLILNDGGQAAYNAAATAALGDPTKLVFDYTVGASTHEHNVGELVVQGGNGIITNGAGIAPDFSGLVTAFPGLSIMVAPPATVTSVVASPASGTEGVGADITITVTMSGAVSVSGGTPSLTLNDGGLATYDAAATAALNDPTKLVFDYTVGATAGEHNVGELTVQDGSLNGATIVDANGNTPDFSGLTTAFPNLAVVTTAPATVTSVAASPSTGTEGAGETITFTLSLSKPVTVSGGTPSLTLNNGGQALYNATATAALGDPTKLVFTYTVGASDHDVAGLTIQDGSLNGAILVDASGNTPDFSGLTTAFPNLSVVVPATVTSVAASPSSGVEGPGQVISITFTMSHAVTVSGGTPELFLNDGGKAIYDAAATAALGDPTKLVFDYTVPATGKSVSALAIVGGTFGGAFIRDAAGITPDFSNDLTTFQNLSITVPPIASVTSVAASPASGVEGIGATITFTLTMSGPVTVSGGTPTLGLNDGGIATYDAAATAALNDPTKLVFDYTVGAADQSVSALAVAGGSFNGATVLDAGGSIPDFSGSLVSFPGLQIVPLAVTSVVTSPASGEVTAGNLVTITLDTAQAVNLTGTPELLLNDGATASYDAAHSTATALVFDYTVGSEVTTDLKVSGIQLPAFAKISLTGAGADLGLQVNTTSSGPTGPSGGTYNINGTQELDLFGASTAAVTFAPGSTGVLKLDNSQSFAGTVAGLAQGNYLDLGDIFFGPGLTLGYAPNSGNTGGILSVSDGSHIANIALLGQYTALSFGISPDGSGHVAVTDPPVVAQANLTSPHA